MTGLLTGDQYLFYGGDIMADYRLGEIEMKFADIIWDNEPLPSGRLVKICEQELKWKKSTTYTILKRVCERELFENSEGVVTSLVSKQEFLSNQSTRFVEETFDGSLPKFLTAFVSGRSLTESEVEELQKIIDDSKNK